MSDLDMAELRAVTGGERTVKIREKVYRICPPKMKQIPDLIAPIMVELSTLGKLFPQLDLSNLKQVDIPVLLASSKGLMESALRVVSLLSSIPVGELEEAGLDEVVSLIDALVQMNRELILALKKTMGMVTGLLKKGA
jgi:hypothetical protein